MIRHWLTVFDIPRTICSHRGPQFTGGWFKAMCSLMGISHAKSVAYLSRSNGRAEVAGRQLFEKLRKIHITNPRWNWFEEMWPALKAHHDTPTPGGLSPHQREYTRGIFVVHRARWAPVPERNKKIGKIRRKSFLNS